MAGKTSPVVTYNDALNALEVDFDHRGVTRDLTL